MTTNSTDDSGATSAEPRTFRGLVLSPSLTVKDLEKSLAWYQDVVGFTVDRKHERDGKLRAVSLRAGAVRLLIGQDDGMMAYAERIGRSLSDRVLVDGMIRSERDREGINIPASTRAGQSGNRHAANSTTRTIRTQGAFSGTKPCLAPFSCGNAVPAGG